MTSSSLSGFYAIWDLVPRTGAQPGREDLALLDALLAARPCFVQVRGKDLSDGELRDSSRLARDACDAADVPLCVNDRVDVAMLVGADAVHVGQDDMPIEAVKVALEAAGRSMLVGVSTHNRDQAEAAVQAGADYIGFGPIFTTRSKRNPDPTVGLAGLRAVAAASAVPVVAIGGITAARVHEVVLAGASAAAVIGAVNQAPDPTTAGAAIAAAFAQGPWGS